MKFYEPGRHQAATQIGAYFALLETIKRYQNEEIEPPDGAQRSRRVALNFYGKFPVWVKMWVRVLYDVKEGRTSDRGSPSRCALSLS